MSSALGIVALVFAVLVLLSRASEPSMVLAEQARTQAAEATVGALQTQLAAIPTPTFAACRRPPYFIPC